MIFTSSSNYDEIRSQVACCHFKILIVNIIIYNYYHYYSIDNQNDDNCSDI